MMIENTIAAWHRLVETKDAAGLDAILAENVVFHSPVVHTPQAGKPITALYLTAALHVLNNDDLPLSAAGRLRQQCRFGISNRH